LDHFLNWKQGGGGLGDFLNRRKNDSCSKIGPYSFHDFVAFVAINRKVDDDRRMDVL
jgi:hypothetical protein